MQNDVVCQQQPISVGMHIGVIVIGRNEGERLRHAFSSIPVADVSVLYVDSGSSDGSVELAKLMNIPVHSLDPSTPFSAARARLEGAEILMAKYPQLQFIQFLDGDCTLKKSWLETAVNFLKQHQNVGLVCGKLEEDAPERSIFNQLNANRWKSAQLGEIESCGGIFLIRKLAYMTVKGFNPLLLTGEEAELCLRVRKSGYKIVRLDTDMASHDSDLVHFSDWWNRAVWGGYGDALEYHILSGKVSLERQRETRSIYIWVLTVPLIGALGLAGSFLVNWFSMLPILCVMGYLTLISKIMRYRIKLGDSNRDAALYALFSVLRKLPYGIGFIRYRLNSQSLSRRPDPHDKKHR